MGQEFGSNGKLIKWSNLFNYNSLEELQASTWLPTPRKLYITNDQNKPGLNINKYLQKIANVDGINNAQKIKYIADLIIDIYDYLDSNVEDISELLFGRTVNLIYDDKYEYIGKDIIKDLIKHENTTISPNLEELAYKNSVSSNIKNIVQDLENMVMAYQPITMDDLGKLAEESEKGAMTAHMSLINPLTKYIMQVQNMVGKKVIGITAVGEKVFFNLSYYYNEGVRNGDETWQRNMKFYKKFNRIQNRYNASKGNGEIEESIKTSLANVNFTGYEDIRSRFVIAAQIDAKVRKEMGVTDLDIENKTELWARYREKMGELAINQQSRLQYEKSIMQSSPVDLLISQLLSAATDNAKELILSKINAGDNLAKCHLYLLMLGFDIKDVVTFMTSPYVNLINDLSESNMMDNFMSKVSIKDAIDLSKGIINPKNFLFGTENVYIDDFTRGIRTREDITFNALKASTLYKPLLDDYKLINPEVTTIPNLSTFIQLYIQKRLRGEELERLAYYAYKTEKSSSFENIKQLNWLSDYVDKLVYQISKAKSKYKDISDFEKDQEEFEKILKLADETSTLGGTFLGLNQGLPSSKEDLMNSIRNITNTVTTREKEFNLKAHIFNQPSEKNKDSKRAIKEKYKAYNNIISDIINNNPFLVKTTEEGINNTDYIERTIKLAHAFGLIENFDFESWINDRKLTSKNIKNSIFIDQLLYKEIGYIPRVIEEQTYIRELIQQDSEKVYLFGDNTNDRINTHYVPSQTQAVIRGLNNAIGIDTKKDRGTSENSYFTDNDFNIFKSQVDEAIQQAINTNKIIVIPKDGIGTGKAQLKERAPKCYQYLQQKLNELKNLPPIKDIELSYRDLVSDYYNLIKGTWNIFDIVNKIPQYKSILKLYSFIYTMDKNTSIRSYLTNSIYDKVMDRTKFIDNKQAKIINTYVNDLLIVSYFRDNNKSFPIYTDIDYLDNKYITVKAKHNLLIDLNTASGRASFKKVFENVVQTLKETGKYGDCVIPNHKNNKLLQDLGIYYEKDGTPKLSLELDMMKLNATPNSQKVFQQYLNSLEQLKTIYINGTSFTDWLILYNLFVNQNQYGSDRLTTIFKNSVINQDSILTEYFEYIGRLDYNKQSEDLLKSIDFNMEDLLIRMSPTISQSQQDFAKAPYIKVRTRNGEIVVKKKTKVGYREIDMFPDNDMLDRDTKEEQKQNYQVYQVIKMKNHDFNSSLQLGLQSNDINVLLDTLRIYTKRGILKVHKENC